MGGAKTKRGVIMSEEKIYQNINFDADKPFVSLSTAGVPMRINLPDELFSEDSRQIKINLQAFARKNQESVQNARKKVLAGGNAAEIYQAFVNNAAKHFLDWADGIATTGSVGKSAIPANIRMATNKLAKEIMKKANIEKLAAKGIIISNMADAKARVKEYHQDKNSDNWQKAIAWADAQLANKVGISSDL